MEPVLSLPLSFSLSPNLILFPLAVRELERHWKKEKEEKRNLLNVHLGKDKKTFVWKFPLNEVYDKDWFEEKNE